MNPCRRLKDNFSIIKEEDRSRLLEAKDKVEKEFNEMKWTLIAETIKKEGGDLYTVSCIPHPSYSTRLFVRETLLIRFSARQLAAPVQEAHGEGRTPSTARYCGC
jgi:hypothetical protein